MGDSERIGPYELHGELGRGAMARVWRGWDPRLDRGVAIKEPLFDPRYTPELTTEMGRRFVAEAKAAARLTHPHIVAVYDADVWDGRPAIVMELVQGVTLAQALEQGPLSVSVALDAIDQLLDAVGFAHQKGVVHRDIKPDNVFLSPTAGVKLADFGVARIDNGATRATVAGAVVGTPGYMSPEQAAGRAVDGRSDIFSVGVLAYEMLAGHNPFSAGDPDATTLLYRIVHEPAPALPAFVLPQIPQHIADAIASALAKDPNDRPQSAGAFRAMLRGTVPAPTPGERSSTGYASSAVTGNDAFRNTGLGVDTFGSAQTDSHPSQINPRQDAAPTKGGMPSWLPYLAVGGVLVAVLIVILLSANAGGGGGGAVSPAGSNTGAAANVGYHLGIQDGRVAVFQDGIAEPVKVSDLAASDLSSEDAASIGSGVDLSSLDGADEAIEEYRDRGRKAKEKSAEDALLEKAHTPPVFTEASASSELPPDQYTSYYGPRNVLNEDTTLAWNEGSDGDGVGEWISIYSSEPQGVSGIYVVNGFPKSERIYDGNNRCKDVTIELSDGTTFSTTLADEMGAYQKVDFGGLHATTYIRITVNSIYGGSKWNDTALSAIKPY